MTDHYHDDDLDQLLNQAEPEADHGHDHGQFADLGTDHSQPRERNSAADIGFLSAIPVTVTLEVASTEIPLKDLLEVDIHSVIAMDKIAGEPLDVKVNGTPFAKAEVVVLNGNYGLRIVELSGQGLKGSPQ